MGNGSHASVHGLGTVDLKFTLEKIVQLRNVPLVPTINKNLVSGSVLCKDRFKVVLESNKFVVSIYMDNLLVKVMIAEVCSASLLINSIVSL